MATVSLLAYDLLQQYERIYNSVNRGTQPVRVYQGSENLSKEFLLISSAEDADSFFDRFGVGNAMSGIHNPFERMLAYELLLQILKETNPVQFERIHKGTPYYFIGWAAFQFRDFGKAIFYIDAAVSEDLKFPDVQSKISVRPSLDFFLLKADPGPSALTTHVALKDVVIKTLQKYQVDGGGAISIEDFSGKFASDLLYAGPQERSLLTSFYTFILEYEERQKQISLRSDTGGSIQPFLDHLFDGARLLESLLEKRGSSGATLYPKITNTPAIAVRQIVLKGNKSLADAEQEYANQVAAGSSFQDCHFASSYIIRNTTGHSLLWPDQFNSGNSYATLYQNLISSILWAIEKLWL